MPRLYLPLLCLLLGTALLALAWTERGAVPLSELDTRPRPSRPAASHPGTEAAVARSEPAAQSRPAVHADEIAPAPPEPPSAATAVDAGAPASASDAATTAAPAPRTHRLRLLRDGAGVAGIEVVVRS